MLLRDAPYVVPADLGLDSILISRFGATGDAC